MLSKWISQPQFPRFFWLFSAFWSVILLSLSWWSYALVDGNLTLLPWEPFMQWQTSRWQAQANFSLIAWQYVGIVLVWWGMFLSVFALWHKESVQKVSWAFGVLSLTGILFLFLGHNAHTRDIYNYLFNAKMWLSYGADPHIRTALEFSYDPWTRFMHNTHMPAPYGYGWTLWSFIPYILSGAGMSFLLSYFAMRGWMVLGLLLLLVATWWAVQSQVFSKSERWWRWALVGLHPLLLMEAVLNGHNDVWMMAPVIVAYGIALRPRQRWHWIVILFLLAFSAFLKFATVAVWPIFVLFLLQDVVTQMKIGIPRILSVWKNFGIRYSGDFAAVCMVLPLLTPRSKFFLPWYAVWFLAWLPFGRLEGVRWILLGLSFTSMLRYVPWMLANYSYDSATIQSEMQLITWSGCLLGLSLWIVWRVIQWRRSQT